MSFIALIPKIKNFNLLAEMKFFKFHIENIKSFDEIIRTRLITMGIAFFIMELFIPVVAEFKGKYLYININTHNLIYPATIIAVLGIIKTILEKFIPSILDKISFVNIFKLKIFVDLLTLLTLFLFFINKQIFTFAESIMSIFLGITIIIYSTTLSNYISFFHNKDFANFQNYKIHLIAETTLLGLSVSALLSYINITLNIVLAISLFAILIIYQIKNIVFFEKVNFKYMLNYHKNKKKRYKA